MQSDTSKMVADRYALEDRLGQGGTGVVWRATDTLLKRQVAVKQVEFPSAVGDHELEALKARVLREARAAARLNHPNAVTVFDVIQQEGHAYIVMELVDGPTLGDMVGSEGRLPPEEVASIGLEVLDALESAHTAGIVHRDVKPANVMLDDGRVKLADFGIASIKDDPRLTASGMIIGSPAFMAPEQANGKPGTPETDLWALGATLYYAVEGRSPFDRGGQAIPTLTAVVNEDPHPTKEAGPLGGVISDLLEKEPAARPTVAEVRRRLEAIAGGDVPADRPTAPLATEPASATPPVARSAPAPARAPVRPNPLPFVIGLLVLAAAGTLIWLGLTREEGSTTPPASDAQPRDEQPTDTTNEQPTEAPAVPADWVGYTDPDTGYTLEHPPGWEPVDDGDNRTDFEDPSTGRYLRVDWTPDPGPSPEGAWYDFEESYSQTHAGYERIQITPTTYKGMDAALWEYTWNDGGATIHAYNLGFINDTYGFALNFVASDDEWADSQDEWAGFKASFQMPPS